MIHVSALSEYAYSVYYKWRYINTLLFLSGFQEFVYSYVTTWHKTTFVSNGNSAFQLAYTTQHDTITSTRTMEQTSRLDTQQTSSSNKSWCAFDYWIWIRIHNESESKVNPTHTIDMPKSICQVNLNPDSL